MKAIQETEDQKIERATCRVYRERLRERTGIRKVAWQDIRLARLYDRRFIVIDGKGYDLPEILPEMYSD